jgi:hypothetical protein
MRLGPGLAPLAALLALAACNEPPAGEPVVRTELGEAEGMAQTVPDQAEVEPSEEPADETPQVASACTPASFEDVPITHCIADPGTHRITLANAPEGGQPYGSLAAFAESAGAEQIAFAMTSDGFGDDLKPLGYYVEGGARLSELDRGDGPATADQRCVLPNRARPA